MIKNTVFGTDTDPFRMRFCFITNFNDQCFCWSRCAPAIIELGELFEDYFNVKSISNVTRNLSDEFPF